MPVAASGGISQKWRGPETPESSGFVENINIFRQINKITKTVALGCIYVLFVNLIYLFKLKTTSQFNKQALKEYINFSAAVAVQLQLFE